MKASLLLFFSVFFFQLKAQSLLFSYDKNGSQLAKHRLGTMPLAIINGDTLICKGNVTTLNAQGGTRLLWNTLDTTNTIRKILDTTTILYVDVTNNVGCSARKYQLIKVVDTGCSNSKSLCPNGNSAISMTPMLGAIGYRWQVNSGAGFISITDNATYSGSGTPILSLNSVPTSFYGYQYRCTYTINGVLNIGSATSLKFTSLWNGSLNADWFNLANWNCGSIPDSNTDVIIRDGAFNYPYLNADVSIRSLTVSNGKIFVNNGFKLNLTGAR